MKERLSQASDGANQWEKVGQAIGVALGQGIVEKAVSRKNYLLFSITTISFKDKSKDIGFGMFGNVWITNKLDGQDPTQISEEDEYPSVDTSVGIVNETNSLKSEMAPNRDIPVYTSVIGNPIKMGDFQVAEMDFPIEMNWEEASLACAALNDGWRLPTINELKKICSSKEQIGGFEMGDFSYWSSTPFGEGFMEIVHIEGCWGNSSAQDGDKKSMNKARAVRTIEKKY
jgi:hypothetical protein